MRTVAESTGVRIARPGGRIEAVGGIAFDRVFIALATWLMVGFGLDLWAHHHVATLETFFTPWHAVLYSGFLTIAALLVAALLRNRLSGAAWNRALPKGYELSLVGVGLFAAGGLGDAIWHQLFGIERGLEAALSPSHLVLFFSAGLIVSGPLRAAWARGESRLPGEAATLQKKEEKVMGGHPPIPPAGGLGPLHPPDTGEGKFVGEDSRRPPAGGLRPLHLRSGRWETMLPMLLSLAYILAILTTVTMYANPFSEPRAAFGHGARSVSTGQALGLASILLTTGIIMGMLLLVVRHWSLPMGSLSLILAVGTALANVATDEHLMILVLAAAGLVADVLVRLLKPSPARPGAFRLFAAAVPAVLFAVYFVALMGTDGITWSVALWSGSIATAAIVGWLMSYLLMPPAPPVGMAERNA